MTATQVWVNDGKHLLDLAGLSIVDFTPRKNGNPPQLHLYWRDGTSWTASGPEAFSLRRAISQVYPHLQTGV